MKKKIYTFQVNTLKVGATSNIGDEFQKKISEKSKIKNAEHFWECARRGNHKEIFLMKTKKLLINVKWISEFRHFV